MKLPESIRQYLGEWLTTQFACGYVRLDSDGRVVSWSGDIEKLGISQLHEGRAVSEQLIFTEGLLPSNEPSTYLPMVLIEGCRPLDVHLVREHDGYGLLLIDACSEKQRLTGYQQKVNEYALWKEKQHTSYINKIASALGHDTSGNFFKACNIAALR